VTNTDDAAKTLFLAGEPSLVTVEGSALKKDSRRKSSVTVVSREFSVMIAGASWAGGGGGEAKAPDSQVETAMLSTTPINAIAMSDDAPTRTRPIFKLWYLAVPNIYAFSFRCSHIEGENLNSFLVC
jgi:hypothetical protein